MAFNFILSEEDALSEVQQTQNYPLDWRGKNTNRTVGFIRRPNVMVACHFSEKVAVCNSDLSTSDFAKI